MTRDYLFIKSIENLNGLVWINYHFFCFKNFVEIAYTQLLTHGWYYRYLIIPLYKTNLFPSQPAVVLCHTLLSNVYFCRFSLRFFFL